MKTYHLTFTFGACITVKAKTEEEAVEAVEAMETDKLLERASDGFEIQDVAEA